MIHFNHPHLDPIYRNGSNKRPGAYLIFKLFCGILFEDKRLFEGALISMFQIYMKFTSVACRNFVRYYHILYLTLKSVTRKKSFMSVTLFTIDQFQWFWWQKPWSDLISNLSCTDIAKLVMTGSKALSSAHKRSAISFFHRGGILKWFLPYFFVIGK